MNVKVSVIIPTFNRVEVLGETLASVMAQTLTNWECIVVDDGSSDGTDTLMREYVKKDARFKYIQRPTNRAKGGNVCRNIGIENAKGEFIQFLDSDDIISSNKLDEQLAHLRGSDKYAIATCKWEYFTNSIELPKNNLYKPTYQSFENPLKLLDVFAVHGAFLPAHAYLLNKKLIDKIGNWKEDLDINQDGDFFNRVILYCSKIIFTPKAEAFYRIGTGNKTNTWSNEERVKKLVSSWQLIDDEIKQRTEVANHPYVRRAKTSIYFKVKKQYPDVIKENHVFFKNRYSRIGYVVLKVLAKLEFLYLSKLKN